MRRRKQRFASELDRSAAIEHLAAALYDLHGDEYQAPKDIRHLLEHRLRVYLRDEHSGCLRCDVDQELEHALEAATAAPEEKPRAPVTPIRRPT